jgi:hypothetical protein
MPGILSSSIATPMDSVEKPVAMKPFVSLGASHPALNTPRMDSDHIGPDNTLDAAAGDRMRLGHNWDDPELYIDKSDKAPKIISDEIDHNMSHVFDKSTEYDHSLDDPNPIDKSDKALKIIPDEIDLNMSHVFDKSTEYDHWLDDPNPWNTDLHRRLFPSQVIGFRWMCDRHNQGGGLVADVVGCGKVRLPLTFQELALSYRHTKQQIFFSGSAR